MFHNKLSNSSPHIKTDEVVYQLHKFIKRKIKICSLLYKTNIQNIEFILFNS